MYICKCVNLKMCIFVFLYICIFVSGRDAGSVGFLHLLFFHVFPFFPFHLSICPKSRGKQKKNKKNNPVRRIWGKSIPDWFFCFFWFFSRFFGVPTPIVQKVEENQKTKKNKKNNPVRRIWGKSIPNCFFCFFGFSRGFLVSQAPIVQKVEENQKKQKKQSCEKNLG